MPWLPQLLSTPFLEMRWTPWSLTASAISVAAQASSAGIYNSSTTPSNLPWNTYNYCNAPHVNAAHYVQPPDKHAELVYLNVMMRHHKRTPDNLIPNENAFNPPAGWNCLDFIQENHGNPSSSARVHHEIDIPSWHPFLSLIWNGTCDEGQLTKAGLDDAIKHGKDFWSVYKGFLKSVDQKNIFFRTSPSDRAQQVAGGLLFGMDPNTVNQQWTLHTFPNNIDNITPNYPCPNGNNIRNAYQSVPAWTDHLEQNAALQTRLDTLLGTTGLDDWNSWYDHFFDVFTSRTCAGHPLPCNAAGQCVSLEDAEAVFAIGDFEYNYIWNTAVNSTEYVQLTFGVMFQELAMNLKSFASSTEPFKLRFYVGHDGSMIRLASGLGIGKPSSKGHLRWPALGSEIVLEVWKGGGGGLFARVIHEGTPVPGLEWMTLDKLVGILEGNVPENIFEKCTG